MSHQRDEPVARAAPAPGEPDSAPGEQPGSAPGSAPGEQPGAATPGVRQLAALSVFGVGVGLVAGLGASLFIKIEHSLTEALWTDLPEALGYESTPGWLAAVLLVTGALIVFGASKMPGHGGHPPLEGLAVNIGPREGISVIIAALGTLSFGAVLGPEAPLMAIGSALGALAVRNPNSPVRMVMMLAGAMAGIGAIFGNPLITAMLLLEVAVMTGPRMANPAVLLTSLASLAAGYTLQVGFGSWSGLGETELGIPGLPDYPEVVPIDLVTALPLAIAVAAVSMAARLVAERVDTQARRRPLATIVLAAVAIGLSAIVAAEITGGSLDLVLFSGDEAIPEYFAFTSVGLLAVVLLAKFVAFTLSLGSGFRGGPIFPAVALGAILAAMASLLVSGTSIAALSAAAIAAAVAASVRLPFLATLMAVLLTASAGGATTVPAIIGTIVGILARMQAEKKYDTLAVSRPPV